MQLTSFPDVKMLQEFEGFHNGFLSKEKNFNSQKGNKSVEIDMEYERIEIRMGNIPLPRRVLKLLSSEKLFSPSL